MVALGLCANAVALWNTRYLNAIVTELRARGFPVDDGLDDGLDDEDV